MKTILKTYSELSHLDLEVKRRFDFLKSDFREDYEKLEEFFQDIEQCGDLSKKCISKKLNELDKDTQRIVYYATNKCTKVEVICKIKEIISKEYECEEKTAMGIPTEYYFGWWR